MEVQIISKDIIRPSTSTPQRLKTYKISILDQFSPDMYVPIVLFYSPTFENSFENSSHLKESFSKTLSYFYPLAGRMKDGSSIDCNDEGATYIEAHVACDMSMVLQQPNICQLQKLIPCNPYEKLPDLSSQALLAMQVNRFDCGGLAISVCIWHGVADASSLATFVKSWAATARSADENIDGVILDCTSIFPPRELLSFSMSDVMEEEKLNKSVTKRFVFHGSKIAALRGKIGNGPDRLTRFEAVSSLILRTVTAVNGELNEINTVSIVVDLRKRMNPPLPQQSFGNIIQGTAAKWTKDEKLDYKGLAAKIRDSIKLMSDDHIRKLHAGNEYLESARKFIEEAGKNPNVVFHLSSWCKFPFYEVDFGWGKPIWVSTAMVFTNGCIFMDTRDGEGIEAWVGLSETDMVKFEQNPAILTYASFNPSPYYNEEANL